MTDYVPSYRIVSSELGHEPQMSYLVRGEERWFPINREGFWADPDGWNDDTTTVRLIMSDLAMAERAIVKAKVVNGTNINRVK